MKKDSTARALALLLALIIASCGESPRQEPDVPELQPQAVAYVNGSPITTAELDTARARFNGAGALLDASFEQTLLQSLINSRAMSLLAEGELDEEEAGQLALKVAAYREELLVKAYLERHATPSPVTQEMVESYYRDHLEEFSGGSRKEFEYFSSTKGELDEEERRRILSLLAAAKENADWQGLLAQETGLALAYRKAKARVDVLAEPLETLVAATPPGEVSPVHVGAKVLLVRVISEEQLAARPLSEVAGEIRKRLAPMQLRKAVKALSAQALEQVNVTYPNSEK